MTQSTIKNRKAKVSSYEGTLTETIHMRIVPVLTDSQREFALQLIGGIGFLCAMGLPGFVESFPWPF